MPQAYDNVTEANESVPATNRGWDVRDKSYLPCLQSSPVPGYQRGAGQGCPHHPCVIDCTFLPTSKEAAASSSIRGFTSAEAATSGCWRECSSRSKPSSWSRGAAPDEVTVAVATSSSQIADGGQGTEECILGGSSARHGSGSTAHKRSHTCRRTATPSIYRVHLQCLKTQRRVLHFFFSCST
jgi:hypothetical protein